MPIVVIHSRRSVYLQPLENESGGRKRRRAPLDPSVNLGDWHGGRPVGSVAPVEVYHTLVGDARDRPRAEDLRLGDVKHRRRHVVGDVAERRGGIATARPGRRSIHLGWETVVKQRHNSFSQRDPSKTNQCLLGWNAKNCLQISHQRYLPSFLHMCLQDPNLFLLNACNAFLNHQATRVEIQDTHRQMNEPCSARACHRCVIINLRLSPPRPRAHAPTRTPMSSRTLAVYAIASLSSRTRSGCLSIYRRWRRRASKLEARMQQPPPRGWPSSSMTALSIALR